MKSLLVCCVSIAGIVACANQIPTNRFDPLKWEGTLMPIDVAQTYVRQDPEFASGYDLQSGRMDRYCPPQPTFYDWHVIFPAVGGGEPLRIAVTNNGQAWRLDPITFRRMRLPREMIIIDCPAPTIQTNTK